MFLPRTGIITTLIGLAILILAGLSCVPVYAQVPQEVITECRACGPTSVRSADVDGDGDTDLISASKSDKAINWYENDGNASPSFTTRVITNNADWATSVYAADVDGDSDIDILSASEQDDKIAWYENDGNENPGFTSHTIATNAEGAQSVYAADLDGDSDIDILSASEQDDKIAWYENDGSTSPSFTSRTITTSADSPSSVFAADVNGDSNTDIIYTSRFDDAVVWYRNDGNADPGFATYVITTDANEAASVFAADIDGDSDTDVISASSRDDKIAWHENDGSETPGFTSRTITVSADGATSVFAADLNGDNHTDILSASENDDKVAWHENDGSQNPSFTTHVITTDALGASSVSAIDVNGDSNTDILSASFQDDTVAWYQHDGSSDPLFVETPLTEPSLTPDAESVYATDINGDGAPDLLSASSSLSASPGRKIAWYENNGGDDPSFTAHPISTDADGAASVFGADVDGDTDTDILSAFESDGKIIWFENDGNEDPSFTSHTITTTAEGARSIYAGDVDRDGDLDIFSASTFDDTITWYENSGTQNPNFTSRTITADADRPRSVYLADIDGDGDTDILSAASGRDGKIAWYENDGSPEPDFTTRTISTDVLGAASVFAVDVDGDSDIDVLSASEDDDKVTWYENDGTSDPSFASHQVTSNAEFAQSVFAVDIDGDGDTDIFSASSIDDKIAWYENDGSADPNFETQVITTDAIGAESVFAADINGNNAPDLLSASSRDDKIAWYKNGSAPPLPVEIATFTARIDGQNAQLFWQTVSENSNAGFRIQRRVGSGWKPVSFIDGAGTTSESQTYHYRDTNLPYEADSVTYRLKQVDIDGTISFSGTRTLKIGTPDKLALQAPFPNPVQGQVTLRYALPMKADVSIRIYDVLGRQVETIRRGTEDAGRKEVPISTSRLSSGTYFVRIEADERMGTKQLTVMR